MVVILLAGILIFVYLTAAASSHNSCMTQALIDEDRYALDDCSSTNPLPQG